LSADYEYHKHPFFKINLDNYLSKELRNDIFHHYFYVKNLFENNNKYKNIDEIISKEIDTVELRKCTVEDIQKKILNNNFNNGFL